MSAHAERVEFLYYADCPSHPEALALLRDVMAGHGLDAAALEVREVRSDEEAVELAFPGSPTIRIDGRDVDPAGAAARPALTCRIYRRPDGRVSPLPSREQIEQALALSLPLGSPAPDFRLRGVDGEEHTLASYGDAELLALVQACNHCPYVLAWEGRIAELQRDFADQGVRIVAINSNDSSRYPDDSWESMLGHAAEQGLPYDYLHDPRQELARSLGAARTPEVFLFDRERRLVYHGAVDDSRDEDAVERRYLRDALEASLAGASPPVAETAPVGCTVKWIA